MSAPVISFLTDYGLVDEFVGVCKSVIAQLAPDSRVIDISHNIEPHDIRAGSLTLVRAVQYMADGVVLAIVDPGVGTARRAVAVSAGSLVFVGPDNGLMAPAVAMLGGATGAVELTNSAFHLTAPGPTFAGRDIFAPVAARLSSGTPMEEFGPPIDPVTLLPSVLPLTRTSGEDHEILIGEVLWVDRFGNAQLNVDPSEIEGFGDVLSLRWGGLLKTTRTGHRANTYADVKTGQVGLIVDSYGLLSICLDRHSAAVELGLSAGMSVTLSVAV